MKTQRRNARIAALRKGRAGMWHAWCHTGGHAAWPSLFSWKFLRSVWMLLCNVTRRRDGRGADRRFTWGREHIGCTAPRSPGVYGRMN